MKYLPFEYIVYKTKLTENEVINLITENIETKKYRPSFVNTFKELNGERRKEYEGLLIDNTFYINRVTMHRNNFKPKITGKIRGNNHGTTITVTLKLERYELLFLKIWFALFFIGTTVTMIKSRDFSPIFVLLGISVAIYLVIMIPFESESSETKKSLKRLFFAEIIENK